MTTVAEGFLRLFNDSTTRFPFKPAMRCWRSGVWPLDHFVLLEMSDGKDGTTIRFDAIMVPSDLRGFGYGREALQWVLEQAALYRVRLVGHVERFGTSEKGLPQSQLRAWYKRHVMIVARSGLIMFPIKREGANDDASSAVRGVRTA